MAYILAVGVAYAIARYHFLVITSATAAGLSGYEEKELNGKTIAILFPGADTENHPAQEIVKEKELKSEEFSLKTKNGRDIPVLLSSSILKDEAGKAGGIVCVAKDISERIKLEEEILKSKKLESLGFLAGGIAHDFNNLLGVIIGNINLARDELAGGRQSPCICRR
jgi:PAS domain S-box-containing protein